MATDTPMVVMTTKELADYLRVNKGTVYKLLHRRQVPAFKIGYDWRFSKSQIDQWIVDRTKPI